MYLSRKICALIIVRLSGDVSQNDFLRMQEFILAAK
jgi:hypothetical protein